MPANLLDTHALIWFINGDQNLSSVAKNTITAEETINFVSIASLWEIAIKLSLGKLELKTPFAELQNQINENGFEILPITFTDTLVLSELPFHHRDPFDRIIAVQSINNKLTLISKDEIFKSYQTKIIW